MGYEWTRKNSKRVAKYFGKDSMDNRDNNNGISTSTFPDVHVSTLVSCACDAISYSPISRYILSHCCAAREGIDQTSEML